MLPGLLGCACSTLLHEVTVVTVHDIVIQNSKSSPGGQLRLTHVLLTPPLDYQLSDVESADLPLFGRVETQAANITALPYVGQVQRVSNIDNGNVVIQEVYGGFIIRGSVSIGFHGPRVCPWGVRGCHGIRLIDCMRRPRNAHGQWWGATTVYSTHGGVCYSFIHSSTVVPTTHGIMHRAILCTHGACQCCVHWFETTICLRSAH